LHSDNTLRHVTTAVGGRDAMPGLGEPHGNALANSLAATGHQNHA
jgi:hypothetical protein